MTPTEMLTRDAAERWLQQYGEAWERADPAAAAALFADDCRYYETPYSEPAIGRDGVARYWQAVPEGQRDVRFRHRLLAVDGGTVIAHWQARFSRVKDGSMVDLDGVFLLAFDGDGRCAELREWWHRRETPAT